MRQRDLFDDDLEAAKPKVLLLVVGKENCPELVAARAYAKKQQDVLMKVERLTDARRAQLLLQEYSGSSGSTYAMVSIGTRVGDTNGESLLTQALSKGWPIVRCFGCIFGRDAQYLNKSYLRRFGVWEMVQKRPKGYVYKGRTAWDPAKTAQKVREALNGVFDRIVAEVLANAPETA